MNLDEYMTKYCVKNIDLAIKTNLSEAMISKLRALKAVPSLPVAIIISKACKQKVSVPELISEQRFSAFLRSRNIKYFDLKKFIEQYRFNNETNVVKQIKS